MRRATLAAVVAVTALVGGVAPAGADTGAQQFLIFSTGGPRTVVGTGVINGVGAQFVDAQVNNPDGTFTTTERYVFRDGTLHNVTAGSRTASFDTTTCLRDVTVIGTATLSGGPGAYAGASGSTTFRGRVLFLGVRTPTGCTGPERLLSLVIRSTGTVSVPD